MEILNRLRKLGFIVVLIDGMGTNFSFESVSQLLLQN